MKRLLSIGAAAVAAVCHAGVKYWDNPGFRAYDVGDYVQDGLVVNYDGIRNAGPNAPHNSTATTWVNLGSWGSDYDMTRYSLVSSAWQEGGSTGSWSNKGFVSAGSSIFHKVDQPWTLPESYSVQTLMDATSSGQGGNIGYVICPYYDNTAPSGDSTIQDGGLWQRNDWSRFSIGIRKNSFTYRTSLSSSMYLCAGDDIKGRVGVQQDSYKYMTAMLDSKTNAVIFSGIAAPWSENSNARISSTAANSSPWQDGTSGRTKRTFGKGVSVFGHYPRTDELFKGTLNSIRLYNKVLSNEEVAWNRVVDEYRFFGRSTDIPVTNVVVATNVSGVEGDQPCGAYALDEDGYTFTAPAQRTVKGRRYVLNGYKLQSWNGSGWGEATSYDVNSYEATSSGRVRLEWQYSRPAGEGQLVCYDVSDYKQDGLVVHFDGICNQGESAPHSNTAITWVNLGTGGSANDATLTLGTGGGNWTEDGYRFGGNGTKFVVDTAHTWHTSHTVQTLMDAAYADNTASGDGNYVFSAAWNKAALPIRGGDSTKTVWFHTQGLAHNEMPRVANQDPERFTYATGIHNGTAGTACVFTGTEPPTSGEITTGFLSYESSMAEFTSQTSIGGWGGGTSQYLVGKMKSFRYYSRVLTNDEIAHNRKVDDYRFFGIVPVTNVVVASTYSYLEGYDKCGAYEVDGSYTFVAPANVTAKGIDYACDGYTVETLTDGEWVVTTTGSGNSYRYSTPAETVRLTWRWKAVKGLRSASDYAFEDLAPGAVLHYDGKLNAGIDAEHSTNATKWVNIGTAGSAYDAIWANVGSLDRGRWTNDGYESKGGGRFVTATSPTHHWSKSYTAQALVDADAADNTHESGNFIFAGGWDTAAMVIRGDCPATANRRKMWFHTQAAEFAQRPSFTVDDGKFTYGTAILDGTSGNAVVFSGTKPPTSGTPATGYKHFDSLNSYNSRFFLGSWNSTAASNGADRYLYGTLKSVRYYDRVLTEEELVRNRNVDAVRYFGELGVTNVFVVAGGEGAVQTETGAYKVEGGWTFTAETAVNKRGETVPVARYTIETLVNGAWANKQTFNGNAYTYTEGTSPATVRLKWLGQPLGTMVVVQ